MEMYNCLVHDEHQININYYIFFRLNNIFGIIREYNNNIIYQQNNVDLLFNYIAEEYYSEKI